MFSFASMIKSMTWTARHHTWLLIKFMVTGVVFSSVSFQKYDCHVGQVGGPAQSASQLLRAMRLDGGLPKGREGLDRGLSKGREGLTGREQQPRMSMGGPPGRLTGQGHQARYHLVIKGIMCVPAYKLGYCAQISLASVCATAVSVSHTLYCICARWLPITAMGHPMSPTSPRP